MDKKIKAVLLKKRIAVENIKSLERFQTNFVTDDATQIPEALEDLEKHKAGFFAAIEKLDELDESNEAIEARISERIELEERCRKLKSFLRDNLLKEDGSHNETAGLTSSTLAFGRPHAPNLRLPKIELPTFDGDHTKWLSFRDRFIAMIDASAELPSIAKLQYLLSSLKGDAALPFEHTPLTADNYSVTWSALLKRYDNSRLLIREYYRKLHYLPGIQVECVDNLTHLVDEFTRFVNGLVKLKEPVGSWDTPLSNMLLMKLDRETLMAWEKHSVHFAKDKYQDVIDFVQDRIQILKSTDNFAKGAGGGSKVAGNHRQAAQRKFITNAATSCATVVTKPANIHHQKCPLACTEDHLLRNCPVFIAKDVQQRRDVVSTKRLCWNCLSSSHQVRMCKSDYSCRTCRERHHTLLHITPPPSITMTAHSHDDSVFLETAHVQIKDDYGHTHDARALLDSGSMSNFMSEEFARKLVANRNKVNIAVSGIGNATQQVKGSIIATVQAKNQPFTTDMTFLILKTPSANIPTVPTDISSWKMPEVALADSAFNIPARIDIVIGGDSFWELHTGRKLSLGMGKPWLVETPFGWVVSGNTQHPAHGPRQCHLTAIDIPLEESMQRFWESETISDDPALSVEEDICEKHFMATTTRDTAGRYIVSLPHNSNPAIILGASKQIADRRLLAMERRLKGNPAMREAYSLFMQEYERLGHMKRLTEPTDDSCPHYYLPHHAVVKESSTSTKVRVVFDASCKTTSGYSLNDSILVGPVVQQDLYTILLRFRSHAIAITADVEKMYRQIHHHTADKNFLRIRYRHDPSEPIATFELQTVTYGTASAPFLATRTLKQIALDHQEQYPQAVNSVLRDFYVDDLLTGTDELPKAIEMQRQISLMLQSAGFMLKKWASNNLEALEGIPQEDLALQKTHEWNKAQSVSTLGLIWEPAEDVLRFRIELPPVTSLLTRRLVLSYIARIYDILGLLGPTIVLAKLFMQKLWSLKAKGIAVDWDSELPSHLHQEWTKFHSTLHSLSELRIPRFTSLRTATNIQLHIFADASGAAYGACCYLRAENQHGAAVNLLTAKSKIVSLANTQSIARLELCAARLGVQLFKRISQALNASIVTFCWTDSMTVLHWLNSPPRRWKPFVANRVAQIQQETRIKCWRHVPGAENPADDVSRGLLPDKLLSSQRWWHGPQWLHSTEEYWPQEQTTIDEIASREEERAIQLVAATSSTNNFTSKLFARFSTYMKLRRTTAYILRYFQCLKASTSSVTATRKTQASLTELIAIVPPLSMDELHHAELRLCQLAQQDSFPEDLQEIKNGKDVSRHSRLKWLSPFIDQAGTVRVGGRLRNANITDATKHPIVLSSKHPLTILLVQSYHRKLLHAGPQLLLATLRQRFWIVGGRSLTKSVFHRCHRCFKAKPSLVKQTVADLPSSRVTPTRPFAVCGVDYCGPVFIKSAIRNRAASKAYIAIFVCFSTRAVHIELVGDLTTSSFLAALRRFIARRGQVVEIHSDNATTFKGAAHELHRLYLMLKCKDADRDELFNWCANNEIRWKFIPPRAPHFGGLWEAAVKSAKGHITRTLGATSLTQDGLVTLLAQIEQCLNSRPLVPLSNEPTDMEPLTPGHFLVGSNMLALPQVDRRHTQCNRLKEYELIQRHLQCIWARWYPEYLQQLQARAKHMSPKPVNLKEGQLVIIREDNIPPTVWPMGRIVKLHPGKDGNTRVVTLRTSAGKEVVRAAARLAILPNAAISDTS